MKLILLLMFIINGTAQDTLVWADLTTRMPIEYASEAECDAVVYENAEAWIAASIAAHDNADVSLRWVCHEVGTPI